MKKQHAIIYIVVAVLAAVVLYYALLRTTDPSSEAPASVTPSAAPTSVDTPLKPVEIQGASYHTFTTTTSKPTAELAEHVGLSHVAFTLALNRLDEKHVPQGATFTVPNSFDDLDQYSPFPQSIEAAVDIPKLFIVSQRVQAFGAYEYGKRVRWGVVSTGKQSTQTPSRLYSTNWKGKLVTSTIEDAWLLPWYFNLDSLEGISMHQYDLPGYPASHSCIRMSEQDAMWVYEWAEQWILAADGNTQLAHGTPVIVYGTYAYGKTAPWKKLATDPDATSISNTELKDIVEKYHQEIMDRASERAHVLGQ